jgi:hypothetical protein
MRSLFSISESENLKISAVDGGGENGEPATLIEYWPSLRPIGLRSDPTAAADDLGLSTGRTRTRTLDPLIKSQFPHID